MGKTKEGLEFWHKIFSEDFQPFYDLYGTDENPTKETAIKPTPAIQLPYGCEFIGKEMEVSDNEDFSESRIIFVLYKNPSKTYRYYAIAASTNTRYYSFAREIDPTKVKIQAEIKTLEDKIEELKKELK